MDLRTHDHVVDTFGALELGVRHELRFEVPTTTPGGAPRIETVGASAAPEGATDADADTEGPVPPKGDVANAADIIGENPVSPDMDGAPRGHEELETDVKRTGENFSDASDTADIENEGLSGSDPGTEQTSVNNLARTYNAGANHVDALGDQQERLWNDINSRIGEVSGRQNEYDEDGEANGDGDIVFGGDGLFTQTDRTELINEIIKDPARLQQILDNDSVSAEDRTALQEIHDLARAYQNSESGEQSTTSTLDSIEQRLTAAQHGQALQGLTLEHRTDADAPITDAERLAAVQAVEGQRELPANLSVAANEQHDIVATVQPGDSYWAIKERYGMSGEEYQAFRDLNQPRMVNYGGGSASTTSYFAMLQSGDQLLLPASVRDRIYAGAGTSSVNAASYEYRAPDVPVVPAPQAPARSTSPDGVDMRNALSNLDTLQLNGLWFALDGESTAATDRATDLNGITFQQRVERQIAANITHRHMSPADAIHAFASTIRGIDAQSAYVLEMNLRHAYRVQ